MKRLTEKIILGGFAFIVLLWAGYHLIQYNKNNLKTEAVFEYTAEETLVGRGIVFRDEEVLPQTQSGRVNFLHDDATRVGLDETVAEYFSATVDDHSILKMRELEAEIDMLKDAQNKNINNFSASGSINRDMREQLGSLSLMSTKGEFSSLTDAKGEVVSLLNRRLVATGKVDDFSTRITQLENEYENLKNTTGAHGVQVATSPIAGYFSKTVDGNESRFSINAMENMKISDFERFLQDEPVAKEGYVGKIVKNHTWSLAVVLPSQQIENIKNGIEVSLLFEEVEKPIPATITKVIKENGNDTAVIILSSEIITKDSINLRVADVQISFGRYTGLRIDAEAYRFITNEAGETIRGVYILENHQIKFKIIDPIYENADFVLSRMNTTGSTNKESVRLFDQIVTQGTDIHEGKIIQ